MMIIQSHGGPEMPVGGWGGELDEQEQVVITKNVPQFQTIVWFATANYCRTA